MTSTVPVYVTEWLGEDAYNNRYAKIDQPDGMEIIAFVRDEGIMMKTFWWLHFECMRKNNIITRMTMQSRETSLSEAKREVEDRIARFVVLFSDDVKEGFVMSPPPPEPVAAADVKPAEEIEEALVEEIDEIIAEATKKEPPKAPEAAA